MLVRDTLRVLTFRADGDLLRRLDRRHLYFGLVWVWLVGMGRWWDDLGANTLQHLGLGSLVYVFVLSALLWIFVRPLGPVEPRYRSLLTFVCLTAPPAALYAIPVERFTELSTARALNAWFLALVAAWRLGLYGSWLRRAAGFGWAKTIVVTLLPVTLIVAALTGLNLERAVFDIMGGLREPGTANDGAYAVLVALTMLSMFAFPVLLLIWLGMVIHRWREGPG